MNVQVFALVNCELGEQDLAIGTTLGAGLFARNVEDGTSNRVIDEDVSAFFEGLEVHAHFIEVERIGGVGSDGQPTVVGFGIAARQVGGQGTGRSHLMKLARGGHVIRVLVPTVLGDHLVTRPIELAVDAVGNLSV